ncbi:hypothetical protein QTJ16_005150 [Diplocarpon rosae]|uniref:Peptidyl-tRNA hydrolase n=1 Tax=Diplocarpon rosae TaxID=946125 RepID=A0AAD9SWG3_9HELO|nr:hypothetical protein QTJ16_005150 [Diplocarpon rosae]PBP21464.1 peptidyl-tRNA hydrolase [Diplocarpon rosae]
MRISTVYFLALPVLAAAQASPLEQAKAQAEFWFSKISSYITNLSKAHNPEVPEMAPAAAEAADADAATTAEPKPVNVLTLDNWESTIRGSVQPESSTPEEWWVLVTGGNKTCSGYCDQIETAFNQTALTWGVNPAAPNLGYLDCENQPILCSAWSAGPPSLFFFEVSAKPAPVIQRSMSLNVTTTEVSTFTDLLSTQSYKSYPAYEGVFHPFDGFFARNGLAVPLGYFFWAFGAIPNWVVMIGISFLSRSFMSKRMASQGPPPRATRR